jgi:single-strand DNA-binding protein
MVSRITLLGNLGKDPEMRYSKDGNAFTNFSLATKHGFGSKSKTSWWNVTSFGKTAEAVNQYATKGSLLYVEGDCVDEEYTNKEGVVVKTKKVLANTVRFVGPKKESSTEESSSDASDDAAFWR